MEGEFALFKFSLEVVGHGFEGAVVVAVLDQARSVVEQETLGAEVGPLEDVDEFVEVEGFIAQQVGLHEIGVAIGDAAGVQVFKVREGREVEAPSAQGWHGEFAGQGDDLRALKEVRRVVTGQAREPKRGDGNGEMRVGRKGGIDPAGGERDDGFECLQVHAGKVGSPAGFEKGNEGSLNRRTRRKRRRDSHKKAQGAQKGF